MSSFWSAFEHRIWNYIKYHELENHQDFVLAVSGGLDSIVMLEVFLKLRPNSNLKVAYYHHGDVPDEVQNNFREQALNIIRDRVRLVNNPKITFHYKKSEKALNSENEMRDSRWAFIQDLAQDNHVILTAHHLDDHLETLLLKMVRGTSVDGFLSFKMWNGSIFRPFLEVSKKELLEYAQNNQLVWTEDPSNSDEKYLRNWLRENWLKMLESQVPGGTKNLAISLFKIGMQLGLVSDFKLVLSPNSESSHLCRRWYVSLTKSDQLRSLALFLKKHQIYDFTSGQLEEIRKRLDKNQKDITFTILERKWVINASQIMLE